MVHSNLSIAKNPRQTLCLPGKASSAQNPSAEETHKQYFTRRNKKVELAKITVASAPTQSIRGCNH
jgi:hypothetical protein